jgi:tetratricopeptide (TPR) repeat protein
LLRLFKPLADERMAKARLFELKKQSQEALGELTEALNFANAAKTEPLCDAMFDRVRKNSSTLTTPDAARKHALRGELEIKDGDFEQAAKEYQMAIRMMKTYLRAVPDAPDAQAAKDEITKWEYAQEKDKSGPMSLMEDLGGK